MKWKSLLEEKPKVGQLCAWYYSYEGKIWINKYETNYLAHVELYTRWFPLPKIHEI